MRSSSRLCLNAAIVVLLLAPEGHASDGRPSLTLESIFATTEFESHLLENVEWHDGGSVFTFVRANPGSGRLDIVEHEVASGKERVVVAGDALVHDGQPVAMSGYEWSGDRRFLLVKGPVTRTWDSVLQAPHYVYDAQDGSVTALAEGNAALRNVRLSPDGRHVGYVLDNNLYIADTANGTTTAVTRDGDENIFNGILDYGSTMFGFLDAWKWSADGSRLAFFRMDATDVKVFWMIDELGKYNEVRPLKYPNTAEKHAVYRIGVFDLAQGTTTWMDIGDDPDDYIPRIDWTPSPDILSIQRLTRDHERHDLLFADATSGKSRVVLTDTDPAWIDITRDLTFFGGEERFIWTSERSGYRHAYLYDYAGNATPLTSGDWEISAIVALDEQDRWLYFYAKKDSFIDQHVYRVKLDGAEVEKLSEAPGWYEWRFSPDRRHVIETWSDAATPPVVSLKRPGGQKVRTLVENRLAGLEKYAVPHPEFVKVETSDGILVDAYFIKPTHFDATKKYPVVAYGYGNAGSQMVVNQWGSARGEQRDLWHRYMAGQGYIVFTMDNRTTTGRGKAAYNLTYGHYAKWAIHDFIEGANYLRSLPYVDPQRLGFWGWSGGGYLAAALMTKGAPHFQVGISVAPVIDLERYQAVGVERWMDQLEDNPQGYYEVNLMNFADQLQGDLLLIHGSGDDNVKFAFTLQFADSLIKANKQFDMMVYPNEHHGIEGARLHIYTKMANYFREKL